MFNELFNFLVIVVLRELASLLTFHFNWLIFKVFTRSVLIGLKARFFIIIIYNSMRPLVPSLTPYYRLGWLCRLVFYILFLFITIVNVFA